MRPLDPRLIARVGPARRAMVVTAVLGAITSLLILAQALVLARLLTSVLGVYRDDGYGNALLPDGTPWEDATSAPDGLGRWGGWIPLSARELGTGLALLAGIVALRAAVAWWQERLAHRAGVDVVAHLRLAVVDHAAALGPRWIASGQGVGVTTLVTRGLDNLLPYFVRYLPQLMLVAMVTPLMPVVVIGLDWVSAAIVVVTLPLVPIFMVLVGLITKERSDRHLETMQRLTERTMDLVQGLPTLRGLGRHSGPATRVRELGDAHRKATMGSLRVAFLSGMVLELLTTLSVALVAVAMGFRLIAGDISIETALAVLILAPEIYLPLRNVGTHFHASADGLAAADQAFEVLDTPVPMANTLGPAPSLQSAVVSVEDLSIATPDGTRWAPHHVSFQAHPGQITALVGPNGEGKSTLLMALAGLMPVDHGQVRVGDHTVLNHDGTALDWTTKCAWVPQRPDIGPQGRTLSLGQRQRIALERAARSGRLLVLWDEPTAHLDARSRAQVVTMLHGLADGGAIVVVATHEKDVMEAAQRVVSVTAVAMDGAS